MGLLPILKVFLDILIFWLSAPSTVFVAFSSVFSGPSSIFKLVPSSEPSFNKDKPRDILLLLLVAGSSLEAV